MASAKVDSTQGDGDEPRTSSLPRDGLSLPDFLRDQNPSAPIIDTADSSPSLSYPFITSRNAAAETRRRKFYLETYGCQMNVSDSEIVHSILENAGLERTFSAEDANILLLNTCSIREKAEERVWYRLYEFRALQKKRGASVAKRDRVVGVLGCMAERLKHQLLEKDQLVDVVAGPDAYRDLPRLLSRAVDGDSAINTLLSLDETYADVAPVRTAENRLSAYVSIMRGCNNMCSYCIVPWTRGRERSRDVQSIVDEVKRLSDEGFKEVTLLGQNVNSYNDVTRVPRSRRKHDLADHNLSNDGFTQKSKLTQVCQMSSRWCCFAMFISLILHCLLDWRSICRVARSCFPGKSHPSVFILHVFTDVHHVNIG